MEREDQILVRHFMDLSRAADERCMDTFSEFLNIREVALLRKTDLPGGRFFLFGGSSTSERVVAAFPSPYTEESEIAWPVSLVRVTVKGSKFLANKLTHRDYLGAVLGLEIERGLIGDISVSEAGAYIFCLTRAAELLVQELREVGRAQVEAEIVPLSEAEQNVHLEEVRGTVASVRLDAVIGEVYHLARGKVKELIDAGRVAVNAAEELRGHRELREGDVVSARGFGKFRFVTVEGATRKDRIRILVEVYR